MQIPDGTEPIYKVPLRHQSKIVDRPIGTIAKIKRCQYSIPWCAGNFFLSALVETPGLRNNLN
ncbi:hypothetical protein IQ269_08020 [Tychonema sp. LEGE 07199]|uniref:hypothetical protein n=1 Tax=Microcoleaceae TaxID=1892252 RepID=UPI00187E48EB|nr:MULTISPECIES: hypothetical protein [unclassified Tychonema]MBE9120765.1 hypothetical protein [Tychonema sp. LEGE 07199]MBE9133355.1 hypothetical protein [Tychonema sp. LEGE 07196]MBE9163479.1 hypothetical protein [Tychonema sp. LEGE 06208]